MRLALDVQQGQARTSLQRLAPHLGDDLVSRLLDAPQETEREITAARVAIDELRSRLAGLVDRPDTAVEASHLLSLAGNLARQGGGLMGGDGWAVDIGFGGRDQVMSPGKDERRGGQR